MSFGSLIVKDLYVEAMMCTQMVMHVYRETHETEAAGMEFSL